jgi:hypothetical protein
VGYLRCKGTTERAVSSLSKSGGAHGTTNMGQPQLACDSRASNEASITGEHENERLRESSRSDTILGLGKANDSMVFQDVIILPE